jgi:hypothetical protein
VRHSSSRAVVGALDVDVNYEVEVFGADVFKIAGSSQAAAGSGNQDVEATETSHDLSCAGFECSWVSNIGAQSDNRSTFCLEFGNGAIYLLLGCIKNCDGSALGSDRRADGNPQSAGAAGHNGHLAAESVSGHGASSRRAG